MKFCPVEVGSLFEGGEIQFGKQCVSKVPISSGSSISVFSYLKRESDSLIVLLPSALSPAHKFDGAVFHRWSWYEKFDSSVVAISDPSFERDGLLGGWFIDDGTSDLMASFCEIVEAFIGALGVDESKVVFYGSSMGGFGALMLASFFSKSLAVAEVPQIDLREYPWKSATDAIQEKCLSGESISDFFERFPERISVVERFKRNRVFPNCEIITNYQDNEVRGLVGFYEAALESVNSGFISRGSLGISIVNNVSGHKPLPADLAIRMLKFCMRKHFLFNKGQK